MTTLFERLVEAQNAHDAPRMAALFAEDYTSVQPLHPNRRFTGRAQVLENWSAVFAGVPDFQAEILAYCPDGDREWGEFDWHGRHTDGSPFAMRGVVIAIVRNDLIVDMRLYIEPVEQAGGDIHAAAQELYKPPDAATSG